MELDLSFPNRDAFNKNILLQDITEIFTSLTDFVALTWTVFESSYWEVRVLYCLSKAPRTWSFKTHRKRNMNNPWRPLRRTKAYTKKKLYSMYPRPTSQVTPRRVDREDQPFNHNLELKESVIILKKRKKHSKCYLTLVKLDFPSTDFATTANFMVTTKTNKLNCKGTSRD